MKRLDQLMREYEIRHFPLSRQLDLHADGPRAARTRALRWIQSFAHENPGEELLLIVERGRRPGTLAGPVRRELEALLTELEGGLIEWWQPFGSGSLALRLADEPNVLQQPRAPFEPPHEGRTAETAGAALIELADDIPKKILPLLERAAELRRMREGVSLGLIPLLLRRIWIEAQAHSMNESVDFKAGAEWVLAREKRAYEENFED